MNALLNAMTEAEWQGRVIGYANLRGWLWYHQRESRGTRAGFPDLMMVRPPRLVFAELKRERGRVTPEQQSTLDALGACDGVEAYLFRPSDWPQVEQVLR